MRTPNQLQITHYGFANLNFSSYFTVGMQAWARRNGAAFRIARTMPSDIVDAIGDLFAAISVFEVNDGRKRVRFCVDGMDSADYVHAPLLDVVDAYFKVNLCQHALTGVAQRGKILPCLPFFPIAVPKITNRPRLVPHRLWGKNQLYQRLRQLSADRPTIAELGALRHMPKQRDVAFVVPYYNTPAHQAHNEFRYEVMQGLAQTSGIDAIFGFIGDGVPAPYDEFVLSKVSMRAHLERLASSRVLIYVQGVHGCISFKFGELMAMGLPIAGQTMGLHGARFAHLPGYECQFSAQSPAAVLEAVTGLLGDEETRNALGESNARIFDEVLAPECVATDMIERVMPLI